MSKLVLLTGVNFYSDQVDDSCRGAIDSIVAIYGRQREYCIRFLARISEEIMKVKTNVKAGSVNWV